MICIYIYKAPFYIPINIFPLFQYPVGKSPRGGSPSSIFQAMAMADAGQCVARLQSMDSMESRDETWDIVG